MQVIHHKLKLGDIQRPILAVRITLKIKNLHFDYSQLTRKPWASLSTNGMSNAKERKTISYKYVKTNVSTRISYEPSLF